MMRYPIGLAFACLAAAAGCISNSAPGNDREAQLDRAGPASEHAPAAAAIAGVHWRLLHPEIMTEADISTVPIGSEACRFGFTRVGLPVLVYPRAGASNAAIKLNGKLVPLPPAGDGRFAADGVVVEVGPLDDDDGRFPARLVLRLPGAEHELGFHGYAECGGGERSAAPGASQRSALALTRIDPAGTLAE